MSYLGITKEAKIFIFWEGMFKHVQGWKTTNKFKNSIKVYFCLFLSAKVTCMKDYVNLFIKDLIIKF